MRALYCTTPGEFEYKEIAVPQPLEGQTLLKIKRIGICGTDLHAFEGTQPFFQYPRILGHELAAEIALTGAPGFSAGDLVTFIPYFHCGHCIACRMHKPNCCVHMQVCGVHVDGGMREYLVVPDHSLIRGEGLSPDELALAEPLAIGAHGIRRAAVSPDEFVLVVGAGPIGLGTLEFARIAGARVIAMDVNSARLEFCRDKLGIHHTVNPATGSAMQQLLDITRGDMPTAVIDCTGNLSAINGAFQYLAHGGRYVMIGLQRGDISFNHPEFHKREAALMSSRNAIRADFEHVISSMKQGWVNPTNYITHQVGFDSVKADFNSWLDPANGVIKAMVEMT